MEATKAWRSSWKAVLGGTSSVSIWNRLCARKSPCSRSRNLLVGASGGEVGGTLVADWKDGVHDAPEPGGVDVERGDEDDEPDVRDDAHRCEELEHHLPRPDVLRA